MVQSLASIRESLVASQASVLNHCDGQHLEIAAIESTFVVDEFHPRKHKWVKRARTAFNVIVQDKDDSRSLVRYISDVVDFDRRIRAYDRKCKIPLPNLAEPHCLVTDDCHTTTTLSRRYHHHYHRRQRLSLLLKKTMAGFRCQKSNSEKLEIYLRRCALHPTIGRSSLLRDFLSAQRTEDKVVPLCVIMEQICLDQQQQQHVDLVPNDAAAIAISSSAMSISSATSSSSPCPTETEDIAVSTLPAPLRTDQCRSWQHHDNASMPPSSIVIDEEEDGDDLQEESIVMMSERKLTIQDFNLIKVLGGGCTGKVLLVRRQGHHDSRLLALKVISKPQVFLRSQIEHAKTERQILSVLSQRKHPFLVKLQYAFQDPRFLFLAFDFYAGGDLATQLKIHSRFPPDRCRLYAAEMLLGIQELHRWGILYRDLKPENILIGADGHLVLTDFGLSKWNTTKSRANTICGTPEYLAPEVVCGYDYGCEVDYWSYGTILYEMIDGFPPFWDEDPDVMYRQIVTAPLQFTTHLFDLATRHLLTGLLERDPAKRIGHDKASARALKSHRYFWPLDWSAVYDKRYRPQYVPCLGHEEDVSHFEKEFVDMPVDLALGEADEHREEEDGRSHVATSDFDGYSFVNHHQDDEDSNSVMPPHPLQQYAAASSSSSSSSSSSLLLLEDLKSMAILRDSNVTDPHPAPLLLGQQANHGGTSHYWYNTEDVVLYDWSPESDVTADNSSHYCFGNGSALFSDLVDHDHESMYDDDDVDAWPTPPPRPAPVGLSRHYGSRQINPNAVTASV